MHYNTESARCCLPIINRWFFLNVTSDTPAASAIVAWLFDSLLPRQARYNTEAGSPIGSLPAACPLFITSWIMSIARRFVRSLMFALFATRETRSEEHTSELQSRQ